MAKEKFVHKLSTARGNDRSRIWLERDRLTRAGFTPGIKFTKEWGKNSLVLRPFDEMHVSPRDPIGTVAGDSTRPIIDITGKKVRDTFGHSTHIAVTYAPGKITIRGAE